jgi:hypothetical protein
MNAFVNYLEHKWLIHNPELLDIVMQDQEYRIYHGSVPFLTPFGNEFLFKSERLARLILTDLMQVEGKKDGGTAAPWLAA